LRKVLASGLCAAVAAVPAVAFAATGENETNNVNTNKPRTTESVQLRQDAKHKLRTAVQRAKHKRAKEVRRKQAASGSTASPQLEAIAACESGGNPRAVGGGGAFRGKYQFTYASWTAVGGHGDPAAAPEAEQDRRAALLLARSGTANWPICG